MESSAFNLLLIVLVGVPFTVVITYFWWRAVQFTKAMGGEPGSRLAHIISRLIGSIALILALSTIRGTLTILATNNEWEVVRGLLSFAITLICFTSTAWAAWSVRRL